MSEALLIAILNFAARMGIDATIAFLSSRGVTIEDAIAALGKAKEKTLDDYIREDAQQRIAAVKALAPQASEQS
jgi:hypothetical protein